jgi:putative aldouronate transport system substrate-binding protein
MTKRTWLAVSLILCMGLTTACASKTSTSGTSSASPMASTSATAAPVKDEAKPTLKSLQINQPEDYNTYPVAKVLEEKTGYKVQYDMLPADKPEDKLNLIIASAESYDAITTTGTSDFKAIYADYAKKGALVDLTPLIDKYGPNIKAQISQATLDAAKVDGKIYAIPTIAIESVATSLIIRQDWLDKLGLKMPTTIDELTNVLKQFKEKDPGKNGDKNIPMSVLGTNPFVEDIIGAFGLPNAWNDVNGKLVPRVLDPNYKDYVTYIKSLFSQGLLDKEFAVNKDATLKEKLSSGKAGVIPLNWSALPTVADALKKNQPDAKLAYIGVLSGKNNPGGFSTSAGFDRITFVPKASKHPEDAVKWLNAKLDKDTFKLMAIGAEGTHYTFKDGAYTPILPIFVTERDRANNFLTGADEKNYPTYWQARVRKDLRLFAGWDFLNSKQPAGTRYPDKLNYAPFLPNYSKVNQQLLSMTNDYTIKLIFGGEQLTGLDAFQQKYKAAGGDTSIKDVDAWYATFKK